MDIKSIVNTLKEGGIILHRPDTIWGLSCDARNAEAVANIGAAKQRPDAQSYIVLVSDVAMMERHVDTIPEVAYDLIDNAVDPITIIYPKGTNFAAGVCAADGSVGIRVTTDPVTQNIVRQMRGPIVSTSANLSGSPAPKCLTEVDQRIKDAVDATVERQEEAPNKKASTIIKLALNGEFKFIRP